MKAFLTRHRLGVFFTLAFALSWYPWVGALLRGTSTGPNPLGPLLAGAILSTIIAGRHGLRHYFGQLIRWRVGAKWYLVIFGLPVLICLIAIAVTEGLVRDVHIDTLSPQKLRELPDRFIFILLFIGLGEEPGWRGFALPQLQSRHSPLVASLMLAPIWALWHLPLFGTEFAWPLVPAFLMSLFGATLALTTFSCDGQHYRGRLNFPTLLRTRTHYALVAQWNPLAWRWALDATNQFSHTRASLHGHA